MPDKEKVLKGLECCSDRIGKRCRSVCPYHERNYCESELAADALELLKEQEAAYQGAKELLRQKTVLFEDAIRRLKEYEMIYGGDVKVVGEIVRCKDCKYAHLTHDGDCKYCDKITDDDGIPIERYHPGDWFCADGERK